MALIDVISMISKENLSEYLYIDHFLVNMHRTIHSKDFRIQRGNSALLIISGHLRMSDWSIITSGRNKDSYILSIFSEKGQVVGRLDSLWVDEIYRRNGLGRAVFYASENFFRSLEVDFMKIYSVGMGNLIWTQKEFDMCFEYPDIVSQKFCDYYGIKNNKRGSHVSNYPRTFYEYLAETRSSLSLQKKLQ